MSVVRFPRKRLEELVLEAVEETLEKAEVELLTNLQSKISALADQAVRTASARALESMKDVDRLAGEVAELAEDIDALRKEMQELRQLVLAVKSEVKSLLSTCKGA